VTYEDSELSVESGQPVELYEFVLGTTVWRYTSAEDTIEFSSNSYLSRQIDRTSPPWKVEEGARAELTITLPSSDPLAQRYISLHSTEKMTVKITRIHRDQPSSWVVWFGRVLSAKYEQAGAVCVLSTAPLESMFSQTISRYRYHSLCNHVLYDNFCGVTRSLFSVSDEVTVQDGTSITVPNVVLVGIADYYVGGIITIGEEKRTILSQSGDVLEIAQPFAANVVGQTAQVSAGCDHTPDHCKTKFNNMVNYGGFPFVPTKNPFQTGL
jgi:uncharacterized phage protein (TIGR02218 family)